MADVKINVVAKDMASQELKKVEGGLKGMGEAAEGAGNTGKQMGTDWKMTLLAINQGIEIARKIGEALEAAFDYTRTGAQIIQTKTAFEALAGTVGVGTDALYDWREAVGGTVSDLELMTGFQTLAAGMSKEMTAAFAENNDKLLEISKAASALNPQLGDTAFMYESITRGIKRSSPLILDNLGIIVKVGEANENLAKQLGKTVDELTAEEKQMALLNEVLEKGDTLINQLGGSVDAATDPWDRFTTATKNLKNSWAELTAEGSLIGDTLDSIAGGIQNTVDFYDAADQALKAGAITQKEYNQLMRNSTFGVTDLAAEIEKLVEKTELANEATATAAEHARWMVDPYYMASEAVGAAADATDEMTRATDAANAAMRNYNDALLFKIASEGLSSDAALALARSMGLVDERTVYATEKIDFWRDKLDAGEISVETYNAIVKNLADNLERITDKSANIEITWSEFGSPSPPALSMINRTGGSIHVPQAAGGPIHAARGLSVNRPVSHWVGEVGPEPFFPAVSGRIVSNSQAVQALREGGRRGEGNITVNINTPFNFADKLWAEHELIPLFRDVMRKEGMT